MNAEPPRPDDEAPTVPVRSRDDVDEGWSDPETDRRRDRDWYERERPPHHE